MLLHAVFDSYEDTTIATPPDSPCASSISSISSSPPAAFIVESNQSRTTYATCSHLTPSTTIDCPASSSGEMGDVDSESDTDMDGDSDAPHDHDPSARPPRQSLIMTSNGINQSFQSCPSPNKSSCLPRHRIQLPRPHRRRIPRKKARRGHSFPSSHHDSDTGYPSSIRSNTDSNDDDACSITRAVGTSFSHRDDVLSMFTSSHSNGLLASSASASGPAPTHQVHRSLTIQGVAHRLKIKPNVIRPIVNQLVWEGQLSAYKQIIKHEVVDADITASASDSPLPNIINQCVSVTTDTQIITCARIVYSIQASSDKCSSRRSVRPISHQSNSSQVEAKVASVLGKRNRPSQNIRSDSCQEGNCSDFADCEDDCDVCDL